jgi:diguanylate cyclase (GGDEF)-like protein
MSPRLAKQLAFGGALTGASSAILLHPELLPPGARANAIVEALGALPYLLLALVAVAGLRINQTRMLLVAALLAFAYGYVSARPAAIERLAALSIALPLAGGTILLTRETRLFSVATAVKAVSTLLLIAVLVFLVGGGFAPAMAVARWRALAGGSISSPVPDAGWMAWSLAAGLPMLQRDRNLRCFAVALVFGLIPATLSLSLGAERGGALAIGFGSAALILLVGQFEIYWDKVYIDELTQVPNRRALNELLGTLEGEFALAMVDIDFFKKFNDSHGHEAGDDVLRFVAAHLEERARGRLFRYGGEEFCLVYRGAAAADVVDVLDEARDSLAHRDFVLRAAASVRRTTSEQDRATPSGRPRGKGVGAKPKQKLRVTVSMGLADPSTDRAARGPAGVLSLADQALYRAKREGRNRVVLA